MDILKLAKDYESVLSLALTLGLVTVTTIYVIITKRILESSVKQSLLSSNPVIGINLGKMIIGEVYGPSRRNLSIDLTLSNIGNAPAIEVLIDSEIELKYTSINGNKIIPSRFEPYEIPFIRPNQDLSDKFSSLSFGNTLITYLIDDFRECERLNIHRINTDPTQESFKASKLIIHVYYKNNLEQYFISKYVTYLHIEKFPNNKETSELHRIFIPRPIFHAQPISKNQMLSEIEKRRDLRDLCGW